MHTCSNKAMNCWICGGDANSGEHLVKASDLRALFGPVTNKKPLYFHDSVTRNQPVAGIKSGKLKFSKTICGQCNNERTQPHDRAWERLSNYLRAGKYHANAQIRLERLFPGRVRQSMLEVHLFFVKLFGCLIVEYSIPIEIGVFSEAILGGIPHPTVHISFWTSSSKAPIKQAGRTPVHTSKFNGKITFATWFYIVDNISVNVMYAEPTERRKGTAHTWHPSTVGKRLRIGCQ
jgi:hypothetical protein